MSEKQKPASPVRIPMKKKKKKKKSER